jgi:hypothetical protein
MPHGAAAWRMGASTDVRDEPRSPNARWCCAACEAFATGGTEAEAASEYDFDDLSGAMGAAFTAMVSLNGGRGHGGEGEGESDGEENGGAGSLFAAAMRGFFAPGQNVVLNLPTGALPAFLQHFAVGATDQQLQQFIGGGGNVPLGVGASAIADLPKLTVVADLAAKPLLSGAADELQGSTADSSVEPGHGVPEGGAVPLARLLQLGQDTCAICQEPFAVGDLVTTLASCRATQCRAFFHHGGDGACGGGLVKWLTAHTTCPLCRAQVPPRNEKRKRDDDNGGSGGNSGSGGNGEGGTGRGHENGGGGSSDNTSSNSDNGDNGSGGGGFALVAEGPAEGSAPCFACGQPSGSSGLANGPRGGAAARLRGDPGRCPCPAAARARSVWARHRSFFVTAAAHVARRVG